MFPDSCMLLLQGCRDVANQFTYTQCREEYGDTQWPNGINKKQYPICFWFCWSFCVQHIPSLSSAGTCGPHLRSHDRIQRNQITPSIDQTAIQPFLFCPNKIYLLPVWSLHVVSCHGKMATSLLVANRRRWQYPRDLATFPDVRHPTPVHGTHFVWNSYTWEWANVDGHVFQWSMGNDTHMGRISIV